MKAKMQSNNFVRNGIRGSNIQHVAFCMEKKVGNWRSSALFAPPKKQKGCRLVQRHRRRLVQRQPAAQPRQKL
jgi:hypothetical protein